MKKFSVLIGLLIVVFAATASAQPVEFKMSGFMDFVGAVFENIPSSSGTYAAALGTEVDVNGEDADHSGSLANSRARLKFQANAGKELSGTIFFEMDSATWGDANGTRNSMGYWNADRAAVEVKHAFFDVAVPYFGVNVPISMRFGIQPFAIRPNWYMVTDGAGVNVSFNADPVNIQAFWAKPYEGKIYAADDTNVYAAVVSGTVEGFTLGAHGAYWDINEYPLPVANSPIGQQANAQADLYWFGGYADGKYAGFQFQADFIYNGGEVNYLDGDQTKLGGWIAALAADFPYECWDFGGGFWYATGADANSSKNKAYLVPPGSEAGMNGSFAAKWGSVYFGPGGWRGEHATATNSLHSSPSGAGLGGTWGASLYAGLKVTPWYKVYLNAMYLGDTTKNANTAGTAMDDTGEWRDDNGIGLEFTLTNIFQVYKNLTMDFVLGYMLAGDAYDVYDRDNLNNHEVDDPWLIGSRLVYTF